MLNSDLTPEQLLAPLTPESILFIRKYLAEFFQIQTEILRIEKERVTQALNILSTSINELAASIEEIKEPLYIMEHPDTQTHFQEYLKLYQTIEDLRGSIYASRLSIEIITKLCKEKDVSVEEFTPDD